VTIQSQGRYYLDMARQVSKESNCIRRQVGAVIVRGTDVVAKAANGTPAGVKPCSEGGCLRCQSGAVSGQEYEACLCTHAEQKAIALAAKKGISTDEAVIYCTLRPCLTCAMICLESGIRHITYADDIIFSQDVEDAYRQLIAETGLVITRQGTSNVQPL